MTAFDPSVDFDRALVAKYDVAGPRYTSYPTAPQFHAGFDEAAYRARIAASNAASPWGPLSLYLHLPYCASPCFYCGCTRLISRQPEALAAYLAVLCREIDLVGPLFDARRPVRQLHLGGGTPNLLSIAQLEHLMRHIERRFTLDHGAAREFGIEVDPRHADASAIDAMAELGFNRLSVGIQDFDPAVQAAVNRRQSFEDTAVLFDAARRSGFRSINVDLIYGLPRQSIAGFDATLAQVVALRPERIAAYSYAHLPRLFKAQRRIDETTLPSGAEKLALFEHTVRTLLGAGYHYIGMDHFALPGDDLVTAQHAGALQRNFQGYATHADCDIVGLGMTAIGRVGDCYAQNARELKDYAASVNAGHLPIARGIVADADDLRRRDAINELMCHGRLDFDAFGARHGLDFAEAYAGELARLRDLAADGLVEIDAGTLRVTDKGRLLLRPIAMTFDTYLARDANARYSRTV